MTATQFHGVTRPPKLPIPMLTDVAPRDEAHHVVTPVGRDGRLADRSLPTFLGWSPGVEIAMTVEPGPIVIARPGAGVRVDRRGYPICRRRYGTRAGSLRVTGCCWPQTSTPVSC